jgi:putative transposase
MDRSGRWHVTFTAIPPPIPAPGTGEAVGIDLGVAITAALSTGEILRCPEPSHRERARLRKAQRRAERAPRGSTVKGAEYSKAARLIARITDVRKDWAEKTSTDLARRFDVIRLEDLRIQNMTRSARGSIEKPGKNVRAKAGLNRAILAQGWGMLAQRTIDKAPGRVEKVPAPYTSLRCSDCGWIDKNSRQSQAGFVCSNCGFTCNADTNAAVNIAAGHCRRDAPSVREPQTQPAIAGRSGISALRVERMPKGGGYSSSSTRLKPHGEPKDHSGGSRA